MNPISINKLKEDWLQKETIELVQKRRRRYLHFDPVLRDIQPSVYKRVTDEEYVVHHPFLPLLQRIQKNRLYKKDLVTKKKQIKTKERPISYAAHFDALIYSWYASILENLYEKRVAENELEEVVIAYRRLGRSNLEFALEVFKFIGEQEKCVAIAIDIKGFYDNLDHKQLKQRWSQVLQSNNLPPDHYQVFKSVTTTSFVPIKKIFSFLKLQENETDKLAPLLNIELLENLREIAAIEVNRSGKGIPQGTPISCVLSNLYMLPFDIALENLARGIGGMYRRYSDDIIFVCPNDKQDLVMETLTMATADVRLEFEKSKTEVRIFQKVSESFWQCTDETDKESVLQYLGVRFDGQEMSLRHKGYAKFERKMTYSVRAEAYKARELKVGIAKRKLYDRFTPLGTMNYVHYARRAASTLKTPKILKWVTHNRLVAKIKQKIKDANAG